MELGRKGILRERLHLYLGAERAILLGQEYTIGDRRLRRADLAEVRQQINQLLLELSELESRGSIKWVEFVD